MQIEQSLTVLIAVKTELRGLEVRLLCIVVLCADRFTNWSTLERHDSSRMKNSSSHFTEPKNI